MLFRSRQKELEKVHLRLAEQLHFFNVNGKLLHDEIIRSSTLSFTSGEIDFLKFALSVETALDMKIEYLNHLREYTGVTLELNYLSR